jgi:flagellar biosynthesis/type III secretory pathway protein FliH
VHVKRIVGTMLLALSAVVVALSTIGCSNHNPVVAAKIAQAERAVNEAQQAGAAMRAPAEFRTARDKLVSAQSATGAGKHEQATRLAEQAAIDAEYARARSANQRVNAMADEMAQSLKSLRQELERTH